MKELWKNLKKVWPYARDQKAELILYVIFNILGVIISVVVPILSANIIISLTAGEFTKLVLMDIIIFLVENLRNFVHFYTRKFGMVIYRETLANFQIKLGSEILKLENDSLDSVGTGVFIQRLSNDTNRLADIFNNLNLNLFNIIADIGIFGAVFIINKFACLYLLIAMVILYFIESIRTKTRNEKDRIFRKKQEKVSGFATELVRGARDIKMLNSEDSFLTELDSSLISLNQERYKMQNVDRRYGLLNGVVMDTSDLLLILLLVFLIKNDGLAIASALIIYNYSGRITGIITWIGVFLENMKDFNLSCERVFAIMEGNQFKKEKFGKKHLDKIEGNFEFKDVTFGYGDRVIFNHLSFQVNANETVAFVGKSGAGKTTIFNLLCKMYEVKDGVITIDGIDIKKLDKDSIRGNITIISQNPYIFNMSIKDNLRLVKHDLTDEEMIEACRIACLEDFIHELPLQYDTVIGEGGVNLSGGQKQRLAIARALIQKTEIILFDEATSALDNETQSKIQDAIDNMKNEYTILIIAHRLSTIKNADRILYIEDGRVLAEGTHEELLKNCVEYKKLYYSEINKG